MPLMTGKRTEYLVSQFEGRAEPCKKLRESWFNNKTEEIALFVFGECKDLEILSQALIRRYQAILLTGPTVAESSKQKLINLKEEYRENFKIFSLPDRPDDHSMMVNDNLFFEDQHSIDANSAHAYVIENAKSSEKAFFKKRFLADINSAREINLAALENMPVYNGL
jgi:hypothetical protein